MSDVIFYFITVLREGISSLSFLSKNRRDFSTKLKGILRGIVPLFSLNLIKANGFLGQSPSA